MALASLLSSFPASTSPALSSPLSMGSSTNSGSLSSSTTDSDTSARCRYKTGRCTNARVVKPNGSLLLLCEFHRDQQNRTKKRSDMKYRHHRASKRQLDKHTPLDDSAVSSSALRTRLRHTITTTSAYQASAPTHLSALPPALSRVLLTRPSLPCQQLLPIVGTPTMLSSTSREAMNSSTLTKTALFKLSSGLRAAHTGSCISPGKLRIHGGMRDDAFAARRRDIVAMASPARKAPPCVVSLPLCLSPLRHPGSPWAAWHVEDLQLLGSGDPRESVVEKRSHMATDETARLLPPTALSPPVARAAGTSPHRSIILSVCSYILTAEFCVCLATATLTGSLPIYFRKHVGLDSVAATELNNALQALFNLTPIFGAYVADKHVGRFNAIALSCVVYVVGLALITVGSTQTFASLPLFFFGLYVCVALGAGGIKPNVVVLGADQFNLDIPAQRLEKESFFNWFYWSINIGSFLSYSVLANIAVNGLPPYIPEEQGFTAAFLLSTIAFVIGLLVFYGGREKYRRVPPKGSVLAAFFSVLSEAGRKTRRGKLVISGGLAFAPGIVLTTVSYFVTAPTWHMSLALAGAGSVVYGTVVLVATGQSTQWVYTASRLNGGSHRDADVKDVRQVMRLLPYVSIIIVFWAAFSQMKSNFILQGCQMDLRIGDTLLSSATLSILNSGTILVFVPIFDRVVYPFLVSIGWYPTVLRKIGTGLCFSFLAMMVAGWIELTRKHRALVDGVYSNCARGAERLPMSQMSVWWQTLPYLLVGISEILTSITSYNLFYSEVPESMRSACQALNLLAITLGYIVSGALNSIFSFWVTTDLNDGKLENIFFVIAALVVVNVAAFVYVSQSFQYNGPSPMAPSQSDISGFSPAVARAARAIFGRFRTPVQARPAHIPSAQDA